MSPAARAAAWNHWYRRALPAYWLFLFCATHLPKLELNLPVRASDKIAHWTAFGLLAYLYWKFAESFRRPRSPRFVWTAAGVLLGYAALDEYSQRFVGRQSDLLDWLCNAAGIVAVLAVLHWRRRQGSSGRPPCRP